MPNISPAPSQEDSPPQERACNGPCGLPGGSYSHADDQPWGLTDWCDMCWIRQRQQAWNAFNQAVREGYIHHAPACQDPRCLRSDRKLAAHHVNYLEPYNVVWLCSTSCHARAHREAKASTAVKLTNIDS